MRGGTITVERRPRVLLATEGTYPFHEGGVSTWCNHLVERLPDVDFDILAIAMNPYVKVRFSLPENVKSLMPVPLWGVHDPSEHRMDVSFADIFLRKQRTTPGAVSQQFVPLLSGLLDHVGDENRDPGSLAPILAGLYRYFQVYDYQESFKSPQLWRVFRGWLLDASRLGRFEEPTVFDSVQALGWLSHFLIVLNVTIPRTDVYHSSAAAFCALPGIVAKTELGIPFLLTEHGVYLREQYLSVGRTPMSDFAKRFLVLLVRMVVRAALHHADQISPVCHFNSRWERLLGGDPRKIRVIYNGVDPERFHVGPPTSKAPGERVEVLAVARSDPNKDLLTLLQAASIVHRRHPSVHFTVIGAKTVPAYHERLLAVRTDLKLDQVVTFQGPVADVEAYYRGADLVVQSSVSEAFPYAVVESMMSGRAMVATEVGGTGEALADTGILVPARDAARLAAGILGLIKNRTLRLALGERARDRALGHFNIQHAAALYGDSYRRLAGFAAPASVPDVAPPDERLILLRALALYRLRRYDLASRQLHGLLPRLSEAARPAALSLLASCLLAQGKRDAGFRRLLQARLLDHARRRSA